MNIKTFSELTQLSSHTIRYYEKIGLLRAIQRQANGHRNFTQEDVEWVDFIKWLKDTGMSLENIRQYAMLREQGERTVPLRMQLLQDHAVILEERLAIELAHIQRLNDKLDYYRKII